MNYIVTDKHEYLKDGLSLVFVDGYYEIDSMKSGFSYATIKHWLQLGWIKEVQKPEFTKDDMFSICEFTLMYGKPTCNVKKEANLVIDNWLNERKP